MSVQKCDTLRILWLEDCPDEIAHLQSAVCEEFHAVIDVAKTPLEAAQYLTENNYHLFLLDIEMTGKRITGIQFAEQIRRMPQYATTPILFLSVYTHCSRRVLNAILHAHFLSKPISEKDLILQIGAVLGFSDYLNEYYRLPALILPTSSKASIEINPIEISYIHFINHQIMVQMTDSRQITINRKVCPFQSIVEQIKQRNLDSLLRQIYRSIIVNVDQIQTVTVCGNAASVYLFQDSEAKPLGIRYRKNLSEYLPERSIARDL